MSRQIAHVISSSIMACFSLVAIPTRTEHRNVVLFTKNNTTKTDKLHLLVLVCLFFVCLFLESHEILAKMSNQQPTTPQYTKMKQGLFIFLFFTKGERKHNLTCECINSVQSRAHKLWATFKVVYVMVFL